MHLVFMAGAIVSLATVLVVRPAHERVTADTARVPRQNAKVTSAQRQAVNAYAAELKRVKASQGTSLEHLLAAAERVEALLMGITGGDPPPPVVDEWPPSELERIRAQLNGIDIHIGDTVHVMADPEFFFWLARSNGRTVDVEFFALRKRAYAPSLWRVWFERTGPESGCVDFTSGELVDLFLAWRRFRAANPGHYVSAVDEELSEMEDDLLADIRRLCPQDTRLVTRELRRLLAVLPRDPLAPKIRARLAAMPQE